MPGFDAGPDTGPDQQPEVVPDDTSTGNSGGTQIVLMVAGPLVIRPVDGGADGVITRYVNDVFTLAAFLETDDGTAAPTDGILTAKISQLGSVIQSGIAVTVAYGNLVTVLIPSGATAVAGTLKVSITRDNGTGNDIQTFGPLYISLISP